MESKGRVRREKFRVKSTESRGKRGLLNLISATATFFTNHLTT